MIVAFLVRRWQTLDVVHNPHTDLNRYPDPEVADRQGLKMLTQMLTQM